MTTFLQYCDSFSFTVTGLDLLVAGQEEDMQEMTHGLFSLGTIIHISSKHN